MHSDESLPSLTHCRFQACGNLVVLPPDVDTVLAGSLVPVHLCGTCIDKYRAIPAVMGLVFGVCERCGTIFLFFGPQRGMRVLSFLNVLSEGFKLASSVYYTECCPACEPKFREKKDIHCVSHYAAQMQAPRGDDLYGTE